MNLMNGNKIDAFGENWILDDIGWSGDWAILKNAAKKIQIVFIFTSMHAIILNR